MLFQRDDIGIDRTEEEAAIVLETGKPRQIMRAFRVESGGIFARLAVLHLEQLAIVAEGPAMERAGEAALVAMLAAAQRGPAMRAGVDMGVKLAALVAGDDHGLTADGGGEIVVHRRDLAFMRQIDPVALEDMLHLGFKQALVGEDIAAAADHPGLAVIDNGLVERGEKIGGHVTSSLQATARARVENSSSPLS
jgi:hypothetical protein